MKHFTLGLSVLMGLMLLVIGTRADARPLKLEDFLEYESVSNPQISPNGTQIIYTRRRVDQLKDRQVSSLWIMNVDGTRKRQLTKGGGALWSPDGTRIALVRQDENEKPQIFVRWMDAEGSMTQITHGEFGPRGMSWSPNGKHIAFLARVPNKTDWTIKLPAKQKGAKWTEDPNIIDTLHYRQDRVGDYNQSHDHIFVVPSGGGTSRKITSGDWNVGARGIGAIASSARLSWSADSSKIAFDGNNNEDWEKNFFVSHIYTVDVKTLEINQLTQGNGTWTSPKFSDDGNDIAYLGFPDRDLASPFSDVWVMQANGGNQRVLTKDLDNSPAGLRWAKKGWGVNFMLASRGNINLYSVSESGDVTALTKGTHVIGVSSVSDNGIAVGTKSSFVKSGNIVRFNERNGRQEQQLTDVNEDIFSDVDFGSVEEIWYDSSDGARVQGWIVKPPEFDPTKKYPLYLSIHGGPFAMYNVGFSMSRLEQAANGYVVVYTNPRGSTGYGRAFSNAIANAYPGRRDFDDLMAGVDATIAKGYIDTDRLFIEGCSGGGVLTNWVVSQTDRFAAAVARCTVTNWISMAGTTDVNGWANAFFEKPYWEDSTDWLAHSPLMHAHKVKTPTLFMTGDKDLRTPIAQAEQYYNALKQLDVPTKLIPMRGEYHGTGSIPSNWLRTQLYIRKWFDEHGPKSETAD